MYETEKKRNESNEMRQVAIENKGVFLFNLLLLPRIGVIGAHNATLPAPLRP